MQIEPNLKFDFKHVLIKPKRSQLSSRSQVELQRRFKFKHCGQSWRGIPIIAANMDTVGTIAIAKALAQEGLATALHKHYGSDELARFFQQLTKTAMVFYSMGITDDDLEKLSVFNAQHHAPKFICIDVANGYSERFVVFVKTIRQKYPDAIIMAGNVVTPEMTYDLINSGADIVKVGIGPGSVCTTRIMTGVGYPQLSAIIECADAAHQLKGHICSDGGCTIPGDIAKAFGGGADFVMLGGMLAGHNESGGDIIRDAQGKATSVRFYGMSSQEAMEKHAGGVANYRASEGKSVELPYRGPVLNTIGVILGGIRSVCTYTGAAKLRHLPKHTTFIRVEQQENTVFNAFNR